MKLSNNILLGRYVPGDSFLHMLDARAKIIVMFMYILLIFLANNIFDYFILFLILIISILASRIRISFILKGIIPVVWVIIITIIFHLFLTKGGEVIFEWGKVIIYSYGIEQAIFISLRILFLILAASLFTLTTTMLDSTMGIEKLMSPLKFVKVPVSEIAFMMSISIRFIPLLFEETEKLINAQKARGANIAKGKINKRILDLTSLIIPIFINTFKKADHIAIAMESKGYRGGDGRTSLKKCIFTWKDFIFILIAFISFIIILKW